MGSWAMVDDREGDRHINTHIFDSLQHFSSHCEGIFLMLFWNFSKFSIVGIYFHQKILFFTKRRGPRQRMETLRTGASSALRAYLNDSGQEKTVSL